MRIAALFSSILFIASPCLAQSSTEWEIGPFERANDVNPILFPLADTTFYCPLQHKEVKWECEHVFNPAAVVRNGKIYLLYRAEDNFGAGIGYHTSRLGLAESQDGLHFKRCSTPVFFPASDNQFFHEWPGGCEDPRIVEKEDGSYVMMYTQWNRQIAVLAVATSPDLVNWTKHGYVFETANEGTFGRRFCKSGSIICRCEGDRLIAAKIQGQYWMYWGEGNIHVAVSHDLISWQPLYGNNGLLINLLEPRPGKFDSALAEAGPPAILTDKGIVFIYNGKNDAHDGSSKIGPGAYAAGQALFDAQDPTKLLARTEDDFFKPEEPFETNGQYFDGTVFTQGLVHFQGQWFLYYGAADSVIGVAVAKDKSSSPL